MKHTILLVDDNKEMLEVLSEELFEKYNVVMALNGKQALDLSEKRPIHLVVSDVMMPLMDGFELCNAFKSNLKSSHIPIILLTAKNTMESRIAGLQNGADAYIEKPFNADYLLAQIANLLENRNKIKDHFAHSPLVHLPTDGHTEQGETFLEKLNETIKENLDDTDLDVDKLARLMKVSRTNLFRKVKSTSDLTPNELINLQRLKKAAELLLATDLKIYEVCDRVGFGTSTNFGRSFFKQFGMSPTDFQKRMQSNNSEAQEE